MDTELKLSLLREKFVVKDQAGEQAGHPPVMALSNRLVLPFPSTADILGETYVIRTQNMHSCVRLAALICKEYDERGPVIGRSDAFSWEHLWQDVIKGYERDWNPQIWTAIYHRGRVIFESGERHPFLDIIEKCDAANHENYGESVKFAESAFQQAGKTVEIIHDSNVALIVSMQETGARCGIILRGAARRTTFTYTVRQTKPGSEKPRLPTVLTAAAAFLEGVQLAFMVGILNRKRSLNLFEKYSDEDRKARRGTERLNNLNAAIAALEHKYTVMYRPDKPSFIAMVQEAQGVADKILRPEIEEKLASGEIDSGDWVN